MEEPLDQAAVEGAASFIGRNRLRYRPDTLRAKLRESGYSEAVIDEAIRVEGAERAGVEAPAGPDLRSRAALILVGAAVAGWVAVAGLIALRRPADGTLDFSSAILMIMAAVLGVVVAISLLGFGLSKSLRRGSEGALIGFLVLPLIVVVGITGTCLTFVR